MRQFLGALMLATLICVPVHGNEVEDESGPPHEDLGRAQEHISTVLCRAPFREREEKNFRKKFGVRIAAVNKEVAAEFGDEIANRGYFSVLPCWNYRSSTETYKRLEQAEESFLIILRRWEARYSIGPYKRKR